MEKAEDIQTYLPLTEVTYLILVSLAPERRHGYAIMKDVRTLSGERVQLSTGTLYGALKRLLEQGWISRADDPAPSNSARERKAYSLTSLGRAVLFAEIERLDDLVAAAHRRSLGENT